MRNRKVIIAFAVILPLLGVLSMLAWANNARRAAYDGAELHSVVRAAKDIPSGTTAAELPEYVEVVKVPKELLPSGEDKDGNPYWLGSLEDADDGSTEGIIPAGEVLLNTRIFTDKERAEDFNVQPGDIEVTVELDGSRGSSKSLKLGDKVTIYASFDGGQGSYNQPVTGAIIHSATISQINGVTDPDSEKAKVDEEKPNPDLLITVAVTPSDSQKLIFAMEFGEVWLGLESPETDLTPLGLTTIEDLNKFSSGAPTTGEEEEVE